MLIHHSLRGIRTLPVLLGTVLFLDASAQDNCKHSKQNTTSAQVKGGGVAELWPVDILHQRITLDLTLGNTIAGSCEITAAPRSPGLTTIPLHLLALEVDSISSQNGLLAFDHTAEDLVIDWGSEIDLSDTVSFTVHYQGTPATDASGFGGMYLTSQYLYNLGVAFTSIPHSYGRAWFPCVDNFTERNTYEFIVRTDAGRNAWCNGELLSEQVDGTTLIRHWSMDRTIPAYLASVSAATYTTLRDTFPSISGDQVPVVLAAVPGDTTALRNSFANLPTSFSCFENWFGPYRWNKVGYVLTPLGAMEHATSIHYPRSIVNGNLQYEDVMAHELGHEWFGNVVTCDRAEEMYINEGFAEYLSYLFLECTYGPERYKSTLRANHRKMVHRAHLIDQGWWALADVPQQWTYGEHSYNKAAGVIHSMRHYLGDENFRSGLSSFIDAYAFQPVNSIQLRDHLSQTTGVDMSDFFTDWIFQPGWAAFEVDSFSTTQDGAVFTTTVHVQQKMRGPALPYNNVPMTVSFMNNEGGLWQAPAPFMLGGNSTEFIVAAPFAPAAVLLNADERMSLGITYDRDTLTQTGSISYTSTDIRLTVNSLPGPMPIHIEEYWVAADPQAEENFAFVVSPDRWWRITGAIPEEASISGRIQYDGRTTQAGSLDLELMQDAAGIAFREDSLVLLYRPDQHSMWSPHPDFTVNIVGNATDKMGRIDFNGVRVGEYTLGWRKSAVGLADAIEKDHAWTILPNPTSDRLDVQWKGNDPVNGTLQLWDQRGRLALEAPVRAALTTLDVSTLPMGTYVLRHIPLQGMANLVDRVVIVR
jgi:hypothetical protein